MADVKAIPDNYPRVTPYLVMKNATAAIEFYKDILGATERLRIPGPNNTIGHSELTIGDSLIMLGDEDPNMGIVGPEKGGPGPLLLHVYVEDVDDVQARALKAGAVEVRPVETHFYGDRSGQFEDPFGHKWSVTTHVEDVSPEAMAKRAAELGPQ